MRLITLHASDGAKCIFNPREIVYVVKSLEGAYVYTTCREGLVVLETVDDIERLVNGDGRVGADHRKQRGRTMPNKEGEPND